MENNYKVTNNETNQRFEIAIENEIAYLEYRWYKGDLALMHTLVPTEFKRRGIASSLVKFALEYAKEKQLKIIVYCPFVGKYLKNHTEYSFLIDREYTG
ncbi:hypothetical protein AD998_20170 [bacterium 336/3]|nr:hypothetical protein AD998_20170 [bacterium 336/3]